MAAVLICVTVAAVSQATDWPDSVLVVNGLKDSGNVTFTAKVGMVFMAPLVFCFSVISVVCSNLVLCSWLACLNFFSYPALLVKLYLIITVKLFRVLV